MGPVEAGAYRYRFDVDGVAVLDPRNPSTSESNMGGAQTLNIAISNLEQFAYVGVFSSGVFGISGAGRRAASSPTWEERHRDSLEDAVLKASARELPGTSSFRPSRRSRRIS